VSYSRFSLDGLVAFVTGSARGIGEAIAVGLAEAGAEVAVSDQPTRVELARSVQARIEGFGRRSGTYPLDVRDLAAITRTIDQVVNDFGRLDILVNNAAAMLPRSMLETSEEDWDVTLSVNLKGPFFCSQAAARHMLKRGSGRIINIASQLSETALPGWAAYCASKGGVANLTRAMAVELADQGINVNAIGPGPTLTPGHLEVKGLSAEEGERDYDAQSPIHRRLQPDELVGAAIYLASPAASATTGHLLIVDGGWTAW
jgi:NAD(P)-dependent dehydrogenase (short-subunit alcohol dehydrogenase family)